MQHELCGSYCVLLNAIQQTISKHLLPFLLWIQKQKQVHAGPNQSTYSSSGNHQSEVNSNLISLINLQV